MAKPSVPFHRDAQADLYSPVTYWLLFQCRTVKITIFGDEGVPVQVDGEAWVQPPGIIKIVHKNRAQMLTRDRVRNSLFTVIFYHAHVVGSVLCVSAVPTHVRRGRCTSLELEWLWAIWCECQVLCKSCACSSPWSPLSVLHTLREFCKLKSRKLKITGSIERNLGWRLSMPFSTCAALSSLKL